MPFESVVDSYDSSHSTHPYLNLCIDLTTVDADIYIQVLALPQFDEWHYNRHLQPE